MEYKEELLNNDLNNIVSYAEFFKAFGYKDSDTIFFRTFDDRDKTQKGRNFEVQLARVESILPTLHRDNDQNRGVFFIVNGGGHKDTEVKAKGIARAFFIDGDELSLKDQLRLLCEFPLEPSIMVKTSKSLHAYWLTPDGDIKYFRELQERGIQYFNADPVIKNESRVMRLYGFNHCKKEPIEVKLIKFNPEITYTQRQLHEVLPLLEKKPRQQATREKNPAELIPHGQRHAHVVSQIGYYVARLPEDSENVIMEAVYADFLDTCEQIPQDSREEFERRYMPAIRKFKAAADEESKDPAFYRKAMKAWKEEHPGEEFETSGATWDDVREAGLRAEAEEKKIDSHWKEYREKHRTDQTDQEQPEDASQKSEEPAADPEIDVKNEATPMDKFLEQIFTEKYKPIPTGIEDIDRALNGGFVRQQIIIIAAAPGMGKTTLSQQICEKMAGNGASVLYFNLEMSWEQMIARSLSRIGAGGLNSLQILQGYKLPEEQREEVKEAASIYMERTGGRIFYNPKFINDDGKESETGANLNNIVRAMRQAGWEAKKNGRQAPLAVVDYLHLISGEKGEDVTAVIKRATEELKQYAIDFDTVVILISANNRSANKSGKASMDSGRDTSNIEYSGDVMLSLNYKESDKEGGQSAEEIAGIIREHKANGTPIPEKYNLFSLRIVKSRFSEPYTRAVLRFDGEHSKFTQVQNEGVKPLSAYKSK